MANQPYFRPFVGHDYEHPRVFSRRLLILGESHYLNPEDDRPDFTESLLADVAQNGLKRGWSTPYFRNLFYVLTGQKAKDAASIEWETLWHSLAFYNFVQTARPRRPLMRPTRDEWQESILPFCTILSKLRPQLIVITGYGLNAYVGRLAGVKQSEGVRGIWLPTDGGEYAFARCIYHPSSRRFLVAHAVQRSIVAEMLSRDWPAPGSIV